jgi:multidrug resistance efflux pump
MANSANAKYVFELPSLDDVIVPGQRIVQRAVGLTIGAFATLVLLSALTAFLLSVTVSVGADGTLEPLHVANVRPSIGGIVTQVDVDVSQPVKVGQIVARLDPVSADADLQRLEIQYDESRGELNRARATAPLDLIQKTAQVTQEQTNVIKAQAALRQRLMEFSLRANVDSVLKAYTIGKSVNVDLAIADVQSAEARVKSAVAAREQAKLDSLDFAKSTLELDRLRADVAHARGERRRVDLTAPIDGIVLTERPRDLIGASVSAGEGILEIEDLGSWTARLLVDERNVHDVRVGQAVILTLPSALFLKGRDLHGSVVSVAPESATRLGTAGTPMSPPTDGTGRFAVVVRIDLHDTMGRLPGDFKRGFAVRGKIVTGKARVSELLLDELRARASSAS